VSPYHLILVPKFCAVLAYAGATGAALLGSDLESRRHAAHRVAGPALLVVWLLGYAAIASLRQPLTQRWVIGSMVLSCLGQLSLSYSVSGPAKRTLAGVAGVLVPLGLVVALMVWRPG
jgi:hypothetical protein